MSNPSFFSLEDRVPLISNFLNTQSRKIVYSICINGDHDHVLKRADFVALGRELLADTQWVYKAATFFNLENAKSFLPDSYSFYLSRRDDFLDRSAKPA